MDAAIWDTPPPTTHAQISITPTVTVDRRPPRTETEKPRLPTSLTPSRGRTESLLLPETHMHVPASCSLQSKDPLIADLFQGPIPPCPQESSITVAPRGIHTGSCLKCNTHTHAQTCTDTHARTHTQFKLKKEKHTPPLPSPCLYFRHHPCPVPGSRPLALGPGGRGGHEREGASVLVMPHRGSGPTSVPVALPLVGGEGRGCPQPACNHVSGGLGSR